MTNGECHGVKHYIAHDPDATDNQLLTFPLLRGRTRDRGSVVPTDGPRYKTPPIIRPSAESSDQYPAELCRVTLDGSSFRVIECRDGIQWIIQHRRKVAERQATDRWRALAYSFDPAEPAPLISPRSLDKLERVLRELEEEYLTLRPALCVAGYKSR